MSQCKFERICVIKRYFKEIVKNVPGEKDDSCENCSIYEKKSEQKRRKSKWDS